MTELAVQGQWAHLLPSLAFSLSQTAARTSDVSLPEQKFSSIARGFLALRLPRDNNPLLSTASSNVGYSTIVLIDQAVPPSEYIAYAIEQRSCLQPSLMSLQSNASAVLEERDDLDVVVFYEDTQYLDQPPMEVMADTDISLTPDWLGNAYAILTNPEGAGVLDLLRDLQRDRRGADE